MGQSLTNDEAAQLRAAVLELGLEVVALAYQLNTTTLLRAAVGLPLHNATRQVISQRLNDAKEAK